ncbi:MAG: hypothetical protein MK289_00235 [Trichodesmium sp. ALOHA_ZT_67]|nr:hypothetical protein [Trichodesmium sp. ALOHA_ZT_67]
MIEQLQAKIKKSKVKIPVGWFEGRNPKNNPCSQSKVNPPLFIPRGKVILSSLSMAIDYTQE